MTPRVRPTMEDWRKARDLDFLTEHPDSIMHVGDGDWAVFDSEAPDAREVAVLPLREAIARAREIHERE